MFATSALEVDHPADDDTRRRHDDVVLSELPTHTQRCYALRFLGTRQRLELVHPADAGAPCRLVGENTSQSPRHVRRD